MNVNHVAGGPGPEPEDRPPMDEFSMDGVESFDFEFDFDFVNGLDGVDRDEIEVAALSALASRDGVLRAALARRPAGASGHDVEPVATTAEALDRLISQLDEALAMLGVAEWDAPVPYRYGSVRRLVGHLLGVERYLLAVFGDEVERARFGSALTDGSALDHVGLTNAAMDEAVTTPPDVLRSQWADAARRSAAVCASADPNERYVLHDLWLTGPEVHLLRAYEIWAHQSDIHAAIGLPRPELAPDVAARMGATLANALNLAMLLTPDPAGAAGAADAADAADAVDPLSRTLRVVLTGPGGGTFDVGPSRPDGPESMVVMDLIDFCLLAAGRSTVNELSISIDGDERLAHHALAAAGVFVRD